MFLAQLGSILLTFVVYSFLINWKIALLLMFGVGFHEGCHLFAAKMRGMNTKGFFLIPFIGGVALITSRYKSYWDQAIVVLAGPFGGGAMAALFAAAYYITGMPVIATAAMWMLFLNVFNLLPISFMDGGQLMGTVTYSISRRLGLVCKTLSVAVGLGILFYMHVGALIFFLAWFGGLEVFNEWKHYNAFKSGRTWLCPDTYLLLPKKLSKLQMVMVIVGHLTTALLWGSLMVALMVHTHGQFFEGLK